MNQILTTLLSLDTYVIADTHFGHTNILEYEPVRVKTLGIDPDEEMVKRWNEVVRPDDIVLHLGDFAWKAHDIEKYVAKLNGRKIILRGNHDKSKETLLNAGFDEVIDFPSQGKASYIITTIANKKIMFSHYPAFGIDKYEQPTLPLREELAQIFIDNNCDINIHGHTHSQLMDDPRCLNVCVEQMGFTPTKIDVLIKR